MRVNSYSYSEVGAVEQNDVVHSGVGGTMDRNLRTEVDCKALLRATSLAPTTCPVTCKCLAPVIYGVGTPDPRGLRRFRLVAGASSGRCGHARVA